MATLNEKGIVQNEQNTTPETSVEISQKDQAIEEVVNDFAREEDILNVNQKTTASSSVLEKDIAKTGKDQAIDTEKKATKKDVESLEDAVLKNLSLAEVKNVVKDYDNEKMKTTINVLLEKYNNLSKWISSAEWNWKTKKDLKHRLKQNIDSLNRMKEDLDKINYSNLDTYKWRIWELIYYFEHYEQVRQIVVLWWRTSDIHAIIDSKQDARYAKRQENQDAKYQSSMNDVLHNAAVTWMRNDDMERYEEYLEAVLNWQVEPSSHPFYTKHMQSFAMIQAINPALYWELAPKNRPWQIAYNTYCQRDPARYEAYCRNNNIVCRPRAFNGKIWNWLADMVEYFGWNKEHDPRKRQAWQNAWSILALGWAAIMWFKFFKNLFSKKTENEHKWRKAAWRWAWFLALLNLDKVTKWTEDIFWWHPAEKTKMLAESFKTFWFSDTQAIEIANRYVWAPVATMSALHFIPMYELESQHILENNNGEIDFNYGNFENYVNKFAWDEKQKEQVLAAWKKLDKDKSIWDGLKAFGIATREKFKSLFWSDRKKTLADTEEVKQEWAKMSERVWNEVNAKLFENWFRATNPEAVDKIIEEYEKEKNNKKMNELILKWMKEWLLEFSEDKPYTLNEMLENNNIDLNGMTIKWFKSWDNDVKFNSYWELFDTYFLTEKIKYQFEWVPAKSNEPFKINTLWQLKFDDKNWYEFFSSDTTVISKKAFTNDFPTLKENRDYYVNYLNARRQGKNDVDISQLDIVSKLWINFYSEKEARALNATLKKIKDDLRYYHPTKYGDPFEIKDWVLKIKIEFTTIWESKKTRDISWLKTFSNETNKEKLLKYLNDETNKMWWSSL